MPAINLAARGDVVVLTGGDVVLVLVVGVVALLALGVAAALLRGVLSAGQGTEKMQAIARGIQDGAAAYLGRQTCSRTFA